MTSPTSSTETLVPDYIDVEAQKVSAAECAILAQDTNNAIAFEKEESSKSTPEDTIVISSQLNDPKVSHPPLSLG